LIQSIHTQMFAGVRTKELKVIFRHVKNVEKSIALESSLLVKDAE
jgi:hypothetical protein